jgi:pimeloyl-ACP methyl ester carboxylesterase
MGYMDIAATGSANGRVAVLLHGKNFCAATWEDSIKALSAAGYRVMVPDHIGFFTSSKPANYQYSFQQLSLNTHALLDKLGIDKAAVIGHSTGGMLATRYALLYLRQTEKLVLVNPIGLEDWKMLGCDIAASINGMSANSSSATKAFANTSRALITSGAGSLRSISGSIGSPG